MKENRPGDKQYELASGNEINDNANANVGDSNNYNSNLMMPIVTPMADAKSFRGVSSNKLRVNGEDDRMGRPVIPGTGQAHYKLSSSQQQLPVQQQYPDSWQSRTHQNYGNDLSNLCRTIINNY